VNVITGNKPRLRPWQLITLCLAGAGALISVPSLLHILDQQRAKPIPAQTMAEAPSEPWVPPLPPKAQPVTFRPTASTPRTVSQPASAPPPMPVLQDSAASSPLEFTNLIRHDDSAVRSATAPTTGRASNRSAGQEVLSERLQPAELTGVSATRLPNPELTIAQGTIIPCIEQTALDSSYPGLITAEIPQDIYSAGGHTVLIDAGSKVVGTMQKGIINGLSREFVLWQQITTPAPDFVRIALDSPAADALGRTGLDGDVNRHIWTKLEGALLLSTVDTGIQAAALGATSALANRSTTGNNLNFYQFQGYGGQATDSLLQSTITIPDTLTRPQGSSCSIFVARDLDFSNVYSLRFKGQR
jgi:type IV secretion system protein VirB10